MSSATSPPFVPSAMLAALISGCFGSMSSAGPTHSPTEEAQWPELEQRARQLALAGGEELALPAQRLAKTGFAVEQPIEVAANTCYTAGVAWGSADLANVTVRLVPGGGVAAHMAEATNPCGAP